MKIKRYFTQQNKHPFDQFEWSKRKSQIVNSNGQCMFEKNDVEVPSHWSQTALDIVANKYLKDNETSVKQLVRRVVSAIRMYGEITLNYFQNSEEAEIFEHELINIILSQRASFNSPVWFNCGVYKNPQCSACFIQSVEDNLEDIFDLVRREAMIFKFGSGTGTNFSKIRAKHEPILGGGTSSGVMSFLDVLDKAAGATKSGGITRRAAKMVCLDIDHPEIEEFITWKAKEEKKVRALVAAGYSPNFEGEAYRTVSGQNSNNSVRVKNDFMQAVLNDRDWETHFRVSGRTCKKYKAKYLWDLIAEAAWESADPGLQFHDTINEWHTCPQSGEIRASNPCSEYMFLDDSACNLASINLVKYLKPNNEFDVEAFLHTIRILIIAQDILVSLSSYPTEKIKENSHRFRTLGLGYSNLGSYLMLSGVPYDSDHGRKLAAEVTSLMTAQAYLVSTEIAEKISPFDKYKENTDGMMRVIQKHANYARQFNSAKLWNDVLERGHRFGFRNAQVTVLAPTGTISFMMDCDTTGIEPDFALVKLKQLVGLGTIKIVNHSLPQALKNLGYNDSQIQKMMSYLDKAQTLRGAPDLKKEHQAVFDCANDITIDGHLKMMSAVQPFLSGAISKTVNLPHQTTVEDVKSIYMKAWELKLKAIAIYRDGCKLGQPLNTKIEEIPTEPICEECFRF